MLQKLSTETVSNFQNQHVVKTKFLTKLDRQYTDELVISIAI